MSLTTPVPQSARVANTARPQRRGGARVTAGLAGANALGVALYLWGASHAWAIPAERAAGITTVTSEPFIWAGFVLPVWAVFGVVDVFWACWVLAPPPRWRATGVVLAVGLAWAVAVAVDFAHH